ncbi:hypothetical protein [Komagataeibacter xylinus]|uniref:hypothetical protein n=1 Tax=Komagataeibacter xylinus TaxID=28448 RepID=UPI000B237EBB|nr:hypothetical protein [Komagataeibacter xylinus]GBQ69030.1 hypothetical protein AA15237_0522 [Komagataeibacter xylinus NBRC 15237]
MTINEYLNLLIKEIRNSGNEGMAIEIIKKAQINITKSKIRKETEDKFWIDLYNKIGIEDQLSTESYGVSALSNIISAVKSEISKKV